MQVRTDMRAGQESAGITPSRLGADDPLACTAALAAVVQSGTFGDGSSSKRKDKWDSYSESLEKMPN
jgi:hypothetical protein